MHMSCACTSTKGPAQLTRGTQNQTYHPRLAAPAPHGSMVAAGHIGGTALRETASSLGEACSHHRKNAFAFFQQKDIPAKFDERSDDLDTL